VSEDPDAQLAWSIRQGIVDRVDAHGDPSLWDRMEACDTSTPMLVMMARAILGELQARLRAGQTITAKHLRGIGLAAHLADYEIPDHAVLRKCVCMGMPHLRFHFYPWDSN
jgi:hypothetical protein